MAWVNFSRMSPKLLRFQTFLEVKIDINTINLTLIESYQKMTLGMLNMSIFSSFHSSCQWGLTEVMLLTPIIALPSLVWFLSENKVHSKQSFCQYYPLISCISWLLELDNFLKNFSCMFLNSNNFYPIWILIVLIH